MNKNVVISIILVVLLLGSGFLVLKTINKPKSIKPVVSDSQDVVSESLPDNTTVEVLAVSSSTKDNTVVLTIKKLDNAYASIAYEVTYESGGILKGVNSGSKPLDVSGKVDFEQEVYLGTCSKNVCRPDTGVTSVSVALEFTDSSGKQSKFSKDFPL